MAKEITARNFDREVLGSKKPVLLDFWASWCAPSKNLAPIMNEIERENPELTVATVNVDEEPDLTDRFGIMNIPAVLLFKDSALTDFAIGNQTKDTINGMIDDRIKNGRA